MAVCDASPSFEIYAEVLLLYNSLSLSLSQVGTLSLSQVGTLSLSSRHSLSLSLSLSSEYSIKAKFTQNYFSLVVGDKREQQEQE